MSGARKGPPPPPTKKRATPREPRVEVSRELVARYLERNALPIAVAVAVVIGVVTTVVLLQSSRVEEEAEAEAEAIERVEIEAKLARKAELLADVPDAARRAGAQVGLERQGWGRGGRRG